MVLDATQYLMYGLSLDMQNLITSSMNQLKIKSLQEVLEIVNKSSLTTMEKYIVIFEIGRKFERGQSC